MVIKQVGFVKRLDQDKGTDGVCIFRWRIMGVLWESDALIEEIWHRDLVKIVADYAFVVFVMWDVT